MVKIMENPIKMDDLGVFPYFWKHPFSIYLQESSQEMTSCLQNSCHGTQASPPKRAIDSGVVLNPISSCSFAWSISCGEKTRHPQKSP